MKKITFITGSLPPIHCGVGYYSHRLLENLKHESVSLDVISSQSVKNDLNLHLSTAPNWKIRMLPKLIRLIRAQEPDIIHIQYPAVGYRRRLGINLLPYVLRIFVRKPRLVLTLHEYHESRLIGKLRNLITLLPIKEIIVSNEADKQALPFDLGKRASVVPIGSNIKKVNKEPEIFERLMVKLGLNPAAQTLLFFGFPYPNKGLETLLEAMSDERLAGYQLLLLCDLNVRQPYQRKLIELINNLNGKNKRVAWAGFLNDHDVSAILQEGKYFILPQQSPITAKSGTAITAVTHNLILVTAGSSKNPEQSAPFIHQKNSFLLDEMRPETLVDAIQELDNSPDKQKRIILGLKDLDQYFSWDNIVKRHWELYDKHQ